MPVNSCRIGRVRCSTGRISVDARGAGDRQSKRIELFFLARVDGWDCLQLAGVFHPIHT